MKNSRSRLFSSDSLLKISYRHWCPHSDLFRDSDHIFNNRWTPHAPKVLLTDQAGFTAGRQMFWNIRKSLDAVDFARERDLDLALVASDYKKAFDQLDRGFLFRTLNRMLGVTQPCANYSRAEMDDHTISTFCHNCPNRNIL